MNPVRWSTFAALRHRNFRLFYSGQMISLTGSWMQSVAFSWLVLVLTDSAFYLGLVGALQTLPVLIFSFLGGVVADHTSKLRLLFITQSALMLLALVLGDKTGDMPARVWSDVLAKCPGPFALGDYVGVKAQASSYQGEIQLTVQYISTVAALREMGREPKEFDPELLHRATPYDRQELWRELWEMAEANLKPPLNLRQNRRNHNQNWKQSSR